LATVCSSKTCNQGGQGLRGKEDPNKQVNVLGNSQNSQFLALDRVSFEVKAGEILGIIGRNGAGKSTLLKILSRVTSPSQGRVLIKGRIASLLEVGTGFHPELTGRENIFLNGAIMGMTKRHIRARLEEIIEFSGVERHIDTPVKRYSSGMYVRLAFAVAAHLDSEILVFDEVLAVGDAEFQKKCLGKMGAISKSGRTILFVSHNMGAISELCTTGILLAKGRLIQAAAVNQVIANYLTTNSLAASTQLATADQTKECKISEIYLANGSGQRIANFDLQDEIRVTILYEVRTRLKGLQLTVTVVHDIQPLCHSFDTDDQDTIPDTEPGTYKAEYSIPGMFLKAGDYKLTIHAGTPDRLIENLEAIASFSIQELTINTHARGYRFDRPGQIISQGKWQKQKL
jgi:lipopolysaccharide transport system ATP-binding protein